MASNDEQFPARQPRDRTDQRFPTQSRSGRKVVVAIYVADHCSICRFAYEVAETIGRRFPQVRLRIIDLNDTSEAVPESVFATPTYLIDGRLWSLGNPSEQEIIDALSEALGRAE